MSAGPRSLEFTPQAEEELSEQEGFYAERSEEIADDFFAEVSDALDAICVDPAIGRPGSANTMIYPLRRYPIHIIYRDDGEVVLIVAIAHHSRRPGYWKDRLQD